MCYKSAHPPICSSIFSFLSGSKLQWHQTKESRPYVIVSCSSEEKCERMCAICDVYRANSRGYQILITLLLKFTSYHIFLTIVSLYSGFHVDPEIFMFKFNTTAGVITCVHTYSDVLRFCNTH